MCLWERPDELGADGDLRSVRHSFRARRRRLSLFHRGSALSRFRRRSRGNRARPLSPTLDGRVVRAGPSYLALLEPLPYSRSGAPGAAVGRSNLRRCGFLLQLRRGSDRVRIEAGTQVSRHGGRPRPLPGDHLCRRLPRTNAWRPSPRAARRSIWKGSSRRSKVSIRCPSATSTPFARRSDHRPRRSWSSRSRARAASAPRPTVSCAALREIARRARTAAVLRRGPVRHGPHRPTVRARVVRRHARI